MKNLFELLYLLPEDFKFYYLHDGEVDLLVVTQDMDIRTFTGNPEKMADKLKGFMISRGIL